jgi:subtilisin family serine protease
MNKYLVQISNPQVREVLVGEFEKVGKPEAMADFLIVQTESGIEAIKAIDGVLMVELDSQATPEGAVDQTSPPPWALSWISNSGGSYTNEKSGDGVDIYVVDTGVRGTHEDLLGRVRELYSYDGLPYSILGSVSPTHGTSVAGCAAGTVHGTAKGATIVNCRIDFMTSTIMKALDKILRDHLDKPDNRPSIVNFSGSSQSPMIGDLFERLSRYGVVLVAASGNDAEDQPRYPARNSWVTAVGATNELEDPAYFSNMKCDVYAPGQGITTASVFSDTSVVIISGTSFSCPYYAGLLACLLEGSDKFNTSSLASSFSHEMLTLIMDRRRLPNFKVERSLDVKTAATTGLGGTYYNNPSKIYSDEVLGTELMALLPDVQGIADACRTYNISRNRLAGIGGIDIDSLDQIFIDNSVEPWWFT